LECKPKRAKSSVLERYLRLFPKLQQNSFSSKGLQIIKLYGYVCGLKKKLVFKSYLPARRRQSYTVLWALLLACAGDDTYQQREDYSIVWTVVIGDAYRGGKYKMGNAGCTL